MAHKYKTDAIGFVEAVSPASPGLLFPYSCPHRVIVTNFCTKNICYVIVKMEYMRRVSLQKGLIHFRSKIS